MNIRISNLNETTALSFDKIFATYRQKLYNYIYQKTGSAYYADEVVQVTFTKLWENRDTLKTDIPISAQIFQIAKSSLIDILRKVERERVKINLMEENNMQPKHASIMVDTLEAQVWAIATQKMPPVRSKVFLLRIKDQLSYKEISDKMHISVKTVGRHVDMAFHQIRPLLLKL